MTVIVSKSKKRVQSHVLEWVIGGFMVILGTGSLSILIKALQHDIATSELAIIQLLILAILAMLGQTIVLIRIYEQLT